MTESSSSNHRTSCWQWPRLMWRGACRWFSDVYRDLQRPPQGKRCDGLVMIALPLAILAGLTWVVRLSNFDLGVQRVLYRAGQETWMFGNHPFWRVLYDFGPVLLTLSVIACLIGFFLTWRLPVLGQWRRALLYIILVAAMGPGMIVNLVLKENWGRPRPREVVELGGHRQFEPILGSPREGDGKSFPSGHASVGFFFFAFYFLFRRHRPGVAEFFFYFALILGSLLGVARMAQGGHFFSDVVWAGAICYFTAMALYYALKLDKGIIRSGMFSIERVPFWVRITTSVLTVLAIIGALVATPYRDKRDIFTLQEASKAENMVLRLKFKAGHINMGAGERFHIYGDAYGHGVPTSKIAYSFIEAEREGVYYVVYDERFSGWLAEANQQLTVEVPWERVSVMELSPEGVTNIWIDLTPTEGKRYIDIESGSGDVFFRLRGGSVAIEERLGTHPIVGEHLLEQVAPGEAEYQIRIKEGYTGKVMFESWDSSDDS